MNNFTIGQLILQALEHGYLAEKPRDYVGISQIPYCQKKLYKQIIENKKTELSDQTLLAFLVGSATHEKLQKLLWKHRGKLPFKYRKSEQEIKIETPAQNILKGHADLIAEINGQSVVIDFKIVNENKWRMVKEPDAHYYDQLILYAYGLDLEYCQLCYINKSTGKEKTYKFTVDENRVNFLLDKYDDLIQSVTDTQEPKKPFSNATENWQCRYCQFSKKCWGWIEAQPKDKNIKEIPEELEEEYLLLTAQQNEIKEKIETVKNLIITLAGGGDAIGTQLKATQILPTTTISYDKRKLEKNIPNDLLQKCEKKILKKGYFRFTKIKKEN